AVTPTLSVDALQRSVKLVGATVAALTPPGTLGACASGSVTQKSSRNKLPAVPLFQVQMRALTAPAGTFCVTVRCAHAVDVTCVLISETSVPEALRKSTPTPAQEGEPDTFAQ